MSDAAFAHDGAQVPRVAEARDEVAFALATSDDDAGIRDTLRMILEYEGYEVATSPDGKTALADLEGAPADAVLLDIKMPGMDGLEVLDKIVARESAPPVLMISGHGDIATAIEATRRGAVDFLEKPPQRERILVSIRNALSRTSLRAENERLRQKLEEAVPGRRFIHTHFGFGYRFAAGPER